MRYAATFCFLLACPARAWAQQPGPAPADSTMRHLALREVVVTATRTERNLTEVPIPVTVVGQAQIKAMGALRLGDVLGEQTGLTTVNDHGQGIQLQGLNPEYTLILVDGEPLIGRTAGTLELSRVAVGNIERVEVVKGPASALWGSEALAGVVNIITEKPQPGTRGNVRLRYGTNGTLDAGGTLNAKGERAGLTLFVNRYSSRGYTLSAGSNGPTVPPFASYTAQSRVSYQLSPKTTLSVTGRYFTESQASELTVTGETGGPAAVQARSRQYDYNLSPVLTHRFSDQLLTTARLYHSGYRTREKYTYHPDGQLYDESYFHQTFTRPELQADWQLKPNQTLTGGAGYLLETVEATRYEQRQQLRAHYGYGQYDWLLTPRLNLVLGARYDGHSQYAGQFSPKVSGRYQVRPWLAVRGSAGRGYRAPDFRQLYLNFANPVVGYSVFGTNQVRAKVAQLAGQGQLAVDAETGQPVVYEAVLAQASGLTAESSLAYNLGLQLDPNEKTRLTVNAFRNDLRNLIETATVALKANGQAVYSYRNVTRAYTQGLEADGRYQLTPQLTLSGGYQLLFAKDKSVVEKLAAGEVFRKDPQTQETQRVKPQDYGGLYNRSRHSFNVKAFYENTRAGWSASARGLYRGRYGFGDLNGNTILDAAGEYVPGYWLLNLAATKTFRQRLRLQAGIDNALNYTNPAYISTLPGRLYYASLALELGRRP
ncbi:TonB-dependent receptor plug domain-containing protein [Hymenobacter cellulosilyticus]|uniref:TonB-dependent receptor n=1 Tax=Hymenobacter cellulosilyticus TaxID=2932248 RepID=A0A8T9QE07_9BACT|nr:TonB-dependent receptor [Hymenobacter cellulosilyticus]UOQ74060.1 TonB-dependent receptor [Hymenobacter cellulosilyticus]